MEKLRDHPGTDLSNNAPPGGSDGPRPPGRPRHNADELKQAPLSIRTTASLKRALEEAAKASGRSLAQEIEYRLWRSFEGGQPPTTTRNLAPLLDRATEDAFVALHDLRTILREIEKLRLHTIRDD